MPVASEVYPFQREVGGNQKFMTRAKSQNGAVIPDPHDDGRLPFGPNTALGSTRQLAKFGDQRFFGQWHGPDTIARRSSDVRSMEICKSSSN
jgi:hypothetical protein